jgi:hypothetical protein
VLALPLTAAERKVFERSLIGNHDLRVTVQLLDLNHNYLHDLSSKLVDGQVNIDGSADVTRSASLTVLDPAGIVDVDSNSPNDAGIFADRMVRVVYSVASEDLDAVGVDWVDCPIFCGPVTNFQRDEALASIEAQGKETLLLPPTVAWHSANYRKGSKLDDVIADVLRDHGETRFTWPDWNARISRDWNLTRESNVWQFCKQVRGALSTRHLFYDGRGRAVLRGYPSASRSAFTFTENALTSKPKVTFDVSTIRNTVLVLGGTPKAKGSRQIQYIAYAPHNHPLSPWRLGRNGKANVMLSKIEDASILTVAAARARANEALDSALLTGVDVSFTSFTIPHLEPEDVYTLTTEEFTVRQRVKQVTIPLKVGSDMAVGFHARRSVNLGRIRGRR